MRKRRAQMRDLQVEIEGFQASKPPWQYERLVLHFRLDADAITAAVLERVIRLSVVRYCSVIATARGVAAIEATMEVVTADGKSTGRQAVRLAPAVAEMVDADEGEPADDPSDDEA